MRHGEGGCGIDGTLAVENDSIERRPQDYGGAVDVSSRQPFIGRDSVPRQHLPAGTSRQPFIGRDGVPRQHPPAGTERYYLVKVADGSSNQDWNRSICMPLVHKEMPSPPAGSLLVLCVFSRAMSA